MIQYNKVLQATKLINVERIDFELKGTPHTWSSLTISGVCEYFGGNRPLYKETALYDSQLMMVTPTAGMYGLLSDP